MRSKAFFINGGAGRVLCSIPAFEKYYEESGDKDFIIVSESGCEFYKGHPLLDKRAYDHWHKNLFHDKLIHMDVISPEPYRLWEYYNQKASLAQSFDIIINNKGVRDLPSPTLHLSRSELEMGQKVISDIKDKLKVEKVAVFQPFGRSAEIINDKVIDSTGRSFHLQNVINIIKKLQERQIGVILFSEFGIDLKKSKIQNEIAHPSGLNLRTWASVIKQCNIFIGCDSVGQHLSHTFNTPTVAVLGSTYPENISYPESSTFKVMDLGQIERQYSPIRMSVDESTDRSNEKLMYMTQDIERHLIEIISKIMRKGAQ